MVVMMVMVVVIIMMIMLMALFSLGSIILFHELVINYPFLAITQALSPFFIKIF